MNDWVSPGCLVLSGRVSMKAVEPPLSTTTRYKRCPGFALGLPCGFQTSSKVLKSTTECRRVSATCCGFSGPEIVSRNSQDRTHSLKSVQTNVIKTPTSIALESCHISCPLQISTLECQAATVAVNVVCISACSTFKPFRQSTLLLSSHGSPSSYMRFPELEFVLL